MVPAAFWLYYFNVGDIDAAMKRVTAGGGRTLGSPVYMQNGRWGVQCTDPQGAMLADRHAQPSHQRQAPL